MAEVESLSEKEAVIDSANHIIETKGAISTDLLDGNFGEIVSVKYNEDTNYPDGYWVQVWLFVDKDTVNDYWERRAK
jgi:hypothetical protein